jgi:hypothetical protein
MNTPYTFASDSEPTEQQLAELMHEVALEAKQQAAESDKKLLETIRQAIADANALQKRLEENKP